MNDQEVSRCYFFNLFLFLTIDIPAYENTLFSHHNHEKIIVLLLVVNHHQFFLPIEPQLKNELPYTLSSVDMNLNEFILIIFKQKTCFKHVQRC